MESAISSCPYEPRQSSSLTTGTSTFIRTLARLPPSEVVPHPETVQVVPAVYSSPSDGSMILSMTEPLKSAELSSSRRQMSLEMVQESYCSWSMTLATAMSCCDHHVILDQGSSTHQRASNTSTQQSNLVGEFSSISFSSSNNPSASSAQRGGESL